MLKKSDYFLAKTLGEDFLSSLQKFELWKPGTKTVVDHEEIKTALQIVPRAILSLLINELSPMAIGESKELPLPIEGDAVMSITKLERDVYTGHIRQDSKTIVDFKNRPIPGVALVIMSAFELYDIDRLSENESRINEDSNDNVQRLVDDRLALHSLVNKVVDRKIEEREAINKLMLLKLTSLIAQPREVREEPKSIHVPEKLIMNEVTKKEDSKKGSEKLKSFIDKRQEKKKPKEFSIQMVKGEIVNCPDCGHKIFSGDLFSGCICYGQDMEKKVFIKKTEDGVKIQFSNGWDVENIEMLLEVLRDKNG